MNPNLRRYSKAVAAGNHVVWTGDQVIPVPYTQTGLVSSDDFAFLRIAGAGMVCTGININFRVPSGERALQMSVVLVTADNQVLETTRSYLNGVTLGGDFTFNPAVRMPSGSLWKLRVTAAGGDEAFYPQDMTATYQLRYANGLARTRLASANPTLEGIGFYTVGGTFIVQ